MEKLTDDEVATSASKQVLDYLKFKLRNQDDAGKMLGTHYLEQHLWKWFQKLHGRNSKKFPYQVQSRLVSHAIHEFSLLPKAENQADEDLHQWLQAGVLDLLFVLSQQGHSGGTMYEMMKLFNKLVAFEHLTPITDNPAEWEDMSIPSGYPFWQNKRNSSLFSKDEGKTYTSVSAEDKTAIHHSLPYTDVVQTQKD
jgi:hypothetical protein